VEDHKNESFLKSAWHKLTHQHDGLDPEKGKEHEKEQESKDEEEPKKASGSS